MAAITLVITAINGVVIYVYLDNIIHIVVFHIYSTKQFIIYKFKGGNAQCQKKHHHLLYFVLIEYIVIG